mmetsp:Transcript_23581/g.57102  ORF Transcript_23581/g.57102 Transcript_23581/m.57102 type:complete len:285 (-) Transcript_23581:1052-1906(-)
MLLVHELLVKVGGLVSRRLLALLLLVFVLIFVLFLIFVLLLVFVFVFTSALVFSHAFLFLLFHPLTLLRLLLVLFHTRSHEQGDRIGQASRRQSPHRNPQQWQPPSRLKSPRSLRQDAHDTPPDGLRSVLRAGTGGGGCPQRRKDRRQRLADDRESVRVPRGQRPRSREVRHDRAEASEHRRAVRGGDLSEHLEGLEPRPGQGRRCVVRRGRRAVLVPLLGPLAHDAGDEGVQLLLAGGRGHRTRRSPASLRVPFVATGVVQRGEYGQDTLLGRFPGLAALSRA